MKLIDIINKVLGTNLNVAVTNVEPKQDMPKVIPKDRHFVLSYKNKGEYFKEHFIMIRATDEAQATRLLINTHGELTHFMCECEIEDIIQDSRSENLMYVEYRDEHWNNRRVAIYADPENVLSIIVERCQPVKSASVGKKIEEVIA
ncbi:MAG: hypothetical protein PHX52_03065 [Candidatus Pacebacteria bacterium]|nr:hypothetical protein [Candidatus Paceibacterota bacterium]